jgi:hypothetical protein
MTATKVIESIERAFSGVSRDPEMSLHQAHLSDQGIARRISSEEWKAAELLDTASEWYEVEETDLEECDAATSHLCPQSWRFYIPAFMRMTLKVLDKPIWETDVPHWTLFTLTLRDDYPGIDEHSLQRYRLLTPEQCRAVRDFLVYVRDYAYENPSYSRDAQEALEAYWESVANEFNSPLHTDAQARQ